MSFDVLIVGAGPAGLTAAIRLAQKAQSENTELQICVLEKGPEVGAHILSGCVFIPKVLTELFPDWKKLGAPVSTKASQDKFYWLTKYHALRLPTPPQMRNTGNYIISLANLCRWLAQQATNLGVNIFSGFAGADFILNAKDQVIGISTGEMGLGRDSRPTANHQPGVQIKAKQVILAEGCRGSLTERIIAKYHLRESCDPQTYGLGLKEIWRVPEKQHNLGSVVHSVGWPLNTKTYGGSFMYHMSDQKVSVGFVVGLDYANTYLDPYQEFQRLKHHPLFAKVLSGGERLAYGARALNEGGWQSIPKLSFPGGMVIGCAAGFMNVPRIKGTHTAMQSGLLAADAVFSFLQKASGDSECVDYTNRMQKSWVMTELKQVRNIRPGFYYGLWFGMGNAAIETYVFRGKSAWTFKLRSDDTTLAPANKCQPITYPKPDGKLSFDRLTSVRLSNTNHAEDQPCHLQLKDIGAWYPVNYIKYAAPESRYCPAGVYEVVNDAEGKPSLQINAQNCVHCKTCDIKDPGLNINWLPPQGGEGPRYGDM